VLGDIAAEAGELKQAWVHYHAELDIVTRLAAADPANTQWQRDLAVSQARLAEVAASAGDLRTARAAHQAAMAITARLAAADPAHARWRQDLADAERLLDHLGSA
jgi:hypothetical protein